MPEKIFFIEEPGLWYGIYNHTSIPPALSTQFSKKLTNITLIGGMPHTRPGQVLLNATLLGDGSRPVHGMYVYRSGSSVEFIVASGSLLQKVNPSTGIVTTLTSSLPTGFPTRVGYRTVFAQLATLLCISNGVDENVCYDGTKIARMGIVAPTALTPPNKSAGQLTGTFTYNATLVNDMAEETEPTTNIVVCYNAEKGVFSAPLVPNSDPQIDRWNLYRAVQNTTTFFRINLAPVVLSGTITDEVPELELSSGAPQDAIGRNRPPSGRFRLLTEHQGRLVGVTSEDPNRLYWSDQGLDISGIFFKPHAWPLTNSLLFDGRGGTQITALMSFFEWLLVSQDFGSWSIAGTLNDSTSRIIQPLVVSGSGRGVGVSDQGNAIIGLNEVLLASGSGLYKISRFISGSNPSLLVESLAENIPTIYEAIDFTLGGSGFYDHVRKRYAIFGKS